MLGETLQTSDALDLNDPDPVEDLAQFSAIQNKYTFWFRSDSEKNKTQPFNYKDAIKKIATFQSVERFWQVYDHLKRPSDFKTTEFHLFKDGISPFWEDPLNKMGGKWTIRLKKGISARYWEDLLLAIIGEQFDVGSEICGAVLSVRINEDIISIWNKTADNTEAVNKIREQIRRIVRLPNIIPIEYKRHQDSLEDRSSYRNPNMVWRAPAKNLEGTGERGNRHNGGAGGNYQGNFRGNVDGDTRNKYHGGNNNERGGGGDYSNRPGWKSNRWSDPADGGVSRDQIQRNRDGMNTMGKAIDNRHDNQNNNSVGESGWRKVGASGKPEPVATSRPVRSGSHSDGVNENTSPRTDGWTKLKNPFTKLDS